MARLRRLLPYLFWAALVFAFVVATLPRPPQLPGAPSDKVQHILAFTTLAALARLAYPGVSDLRILLLLSGFGALIEVVQSIPHLHRDADFWDWLADTASVAIVLALHRLLRARRGG